MKFSRSFVATALVAATACLPLLGADGAMLSPMAGTVTVNGQAIAAGSLVTAGDLVATSADGSARMVVAGASVLAGAKTDFRVNNNNQIALNYGTVKVSGNLPVSLKAHSVVPQSSASRYQVTSLNGPVYVTALAGNVDVKSAGKTVTVHAGEAVSFQDTAAPAAASASAGAASAGLPVAVAIGVAAAAAVVTGIVVHQVTKTNSPSN